MINVTKTYLPPLFEYEKYLKEIWKSGHVTNEGKFANELENKLSEYLDQQYVRFVSNGTIALIVAFKALDLKKEVITTPFSYVATTSSLVWENLKPVFVDIEPETLCIDPTKIERAITKKTTAILATHVYGNPCDTKAIQKIADKYNLKVIYDAAHSFGVKYKGKAIGQYGDVSIFSFHATKIFHTIQGGAIACKDKNIYKKVDYMTRFGHKSSETFYGVGINGRNTEFHAAMGLCLLPRMNKFIKKRKMLSELYDSNLDFDKLKKPKIRNDTDYNYAYYPVIFENEETLLKVKRKLEKENIFPRRYFYPSLDRLSYLKSPQMPISLDVAKRVLCLPIYHEIEKKQINTITDIVNKQIYGK